MAEIIVREIGRRICRIGIRGILFHQYKRFSTQSACTLQSMCMINREHFRLISSTLCTKSIDTHDKKNLCQIADYADTNPTTHTEVLLNDMLVINDFISDSEEQSILKEIEPYMTRLRYEYSHWDDAILGYRETERSTWNEANAQIITRLKETAFANVIPPTEFVHVLDLEVTGEIKPHKDSLRYCGDTIAGISLLSDCVMRLVDVNNKDVHIDIFLKRRSLYIMRHSARYDYTHEILHNDRSYFKNKHISKGRRISLICRNSPAMGDERHKDS